MRGAAAERAGARIPDAVLLRHEVRIARLLRGVGVVTDEKIPADARVFGGERMKRGHVVVRRLGRGLQRIAARFEHEDGVAGLGESGGNGAAAGARADDDVVGIVLRTLA